MVFVVNDKVRCNSSYIENYLENPPNGAGLHPSLQSLGLLGTGTLQVLAVGVLLPYYFIRLLPLTSEDIPDNRSAAYQSGRGLGFLFNSEDALNNSFTSASGACSGPPPNSMPGINTSSVTIYKGSVVCQTGVDIVTGMFTCALASAANSATAYVCGFALADIPIGAMGYTQNSGYYQGVNTLGGTVSNPIFLSDEPGLVSLLPSKLINIVGTITNISGQGTVLLLGMTPFGRPGPFPVRGQFG
jgi:hypothetical protein